MSVPSADYDLVMHLHRDFERSRRQLTHALQPYLKRFFELDAKTNNFFDKHEAAAEYEFHRLSEHGNFFEFVAHNYTDKWGDFEDDHIYELPVGFVEDEAGYTERKIDAWKKRIADKESDDAKRKQARIDNLKAEIERLESQ